MKRITCTYTIPIKWIDVKSESQKAVIILRSCVFFIMNSLRLSMSEWIIIVDLYIPTVIFM